MDGFYFVRRAGTELRIEIDGRSHRSDPIPLILGGTLLHSLRYSADPFIVTWNPDAEAMVRILQSGSTPVAGGFVTQAAGVHYEVVANGAFRITAHGPTALSLGFDLSSVAHHLCLAGDLHPSGLARSRLRSGRGGKGSLHKT